MKTGNADDEIGSPSQNFTQEIRSSGVQERISRQRKTPLSS
jgi:hypothetical protein